MPRRSLYVMVALVLGISAGVLLPACGGGDEDGSEPEAERAAEEGGGEEPGEESGSEAEREERERAEAAEQIAVEDRVAYYQLSTSSGLLRARLLADQEGRPPPPRSGPAGLRAAESRVRRTEPADAGLIRIRKRMLALVARVDGEDADAIKEDLAELDSINAALSTFLKREPAQAVLVPD